MKKTAHTILIICVVFTLLFIWGNSLLPGDLSSVESGWVQRLLQPALDFLRSGRIQAALTQWAEGLPGRLPDIFLRVGEALNQYLLSQTGSFLVRKAAHFSEYMLLGFFLGLLLVRENGKGRFFLSELLCLAVAAVDESIQMFSEGRSPQLRDVCVDISGAALGLVVALTLLAVLRFTWRESSEGIGNNS